MLLFIISLGTTYKNKKKGNNGNIFIIVIIRFRSDKRELPVLWHQSLLSFIQIYRQDISTGLEIL